MQKLAASKWLTVCLPFLILILPLFLSGCGTSSSSLPAYNIAGQWFFYDATNGISGEQRATTNLVLTTSDTTIGGTSPQSTTVSGSISDVNISFSWVGSDGVTTYTYAGTVGTGGGTMQGTWSNTIGQTGTWDALIDVAPSVVISGAWSITTSGPQGTIPVTFTQSGNSLTATTPQGQQSPPGTISYLNIAFFATGSDGATYTYIGTANSAANAMSGTWTNTNGQSGTWSATKS
jgi:hypothetical protein